MKELREWIRVIEERKNLSECGCEFYLTALHSFCCEMFIEHQFGIFEKRVVWQEDEKL